MSTFGQVGINNTGAPASNSAMLDMAASDKGLLFPRLSCIERDSLPSPATGLIIYNLETNRFNYFDGTAWCQVESTPLFSVTGSEKPGAGVSISVLPGILPDSSALLDISDTTRGILIPRTSPGMIASPATGLIIYNIIANRIYYFDGTAWKEICSNSLEIPGASGSQDTFGISINTNGQMADPSAILDVSATDKGILIPRMQESQRDAIFPATGLTIYNLTSNRIEFFDGNSWNTVNENPDTVLSAPEEGSHIISDRQITWEWDPVPGADGYNWSTTNDYNSSWNLGNMFDKIERNLECNTLYTRYVWAYNICGTHSIAAILSASTLANPLTPIATFTNTYPGEIIWHWDNPIDVDPSFKWGKINNFDSAVDMGWSNHKRETGLRCDSVYTRYVWAYDICGVSDVLILTDSTLQDPPDEPLAGIHRGTESKITWKWSKVPGADGYRWSNALNYNSAVDMDTCTTKVDTGLYCNTSYTRYVWAYDTCGVSNPVTLIYSTAGAPNSSPIGGCSMHSYTTITWVWTTVPFATGYKWNTTDNYGSAIDMGNSTSYTETGLQHNTLYYRYIWAYNACGHSQTGIFSCKTDFFCGDTLTDIRDGKKYPTVKIADQCWMAKNINIGTMKARNSNQTQNDTIEKWCYDDLQSNCDIYGGMYSWGEFMAYGYSSNTNPSWRQGICPAEWHIPSKTEWIELLDSLGGDVVAGGKMKQTGTNYWSFPNTGASNTSGFTALPTYPVPYGFFGYFWSTTESNPGSTAWGLYLYYNSEAAMIDPWPAVEGFSGRCLHD